MANESDFGQKNYTKETVTNDLKRYLYYGVGSVFVPGIDKDDIALQVRDEVKQGKTKGAALYTAGRGLVAKGTGGGLSELLMQVGSEADGRGAVDENAGKKADFIAIFSEDGGAKLKAE